MIIFWTFHAFPLWLIFHWIYPQQKDLQTEESKKFRSKQILMSFHDSAKKLRKRWIKFELIIEFHCSTLFTPKVLSKMFLLSFLYYRNFQNNQQSSCYENQQNFATSFHKIRPLYNNNRSEGTAAETKAVAEQASKVW